MMSCFETDVAHLSLCKAYDLEALCGRKEKQKKEKKLSTGALCMVHLGPPFTYAWHCRSLKLMHKPMLQPYRAENFTHALFLSIVAQPTVA